MELYVCSTRVKLNGPGTKRREEGCDVGGGL